MILITDGEDNGSVANIAKAVQAAQESDAVIYGIHYVDSGSRRDGFGALEKLSNPTGGRAFHVTSKHPLAEAFADIAEEMRNQYGLGFRPSTANEGMFHRLEVRIARPGSKVQARAGYYR
jgi:VWFA-related protein